MFKYAQIDTATGECVAVSFLSDVVEAAHMILLTDEENVNPMDTLTNGVWVKYIPPDPLPVGESLEEKIAALEAQNAAKDQQIAFLSARDADMQDNQSVILEALLTAGLI